MKKVSALNKLTRGKKIKYNQTKFNPKSGKNTPFRVGPSIVNMPGSFEETGKKVLGNERGKFKQHLRDTVAGVKQGKRKVTKHVVKNKGKYIIGGSSIAVAGAGIAAKKKYDNSKTVKGRIKKAIGR